jgi:hypothetical protein
VHTIHHAAIVPVSVTPSSPGTGLPLRRRGVLFLLGAVSALALTALPASAVSIAASITGGSSSYSSFDRTFGWSFTLNSDVQVTELGIWDLFGNGLTESHQVTIWTSTGTQVIQGTVASGTGGTLLDGFRYSSLVSPTLLTAGSYVIGSFHRSLIDEVAFGVSISTAPEVTYTGSRVALPGFPAGDDLGFANSYFGPNFRFTEAPVAGVPDSGTTLGLLALALVGLVMASRFVNGSAAGTIPCGN